MTSQKKQNKIRLVLFDADGVLFDVTGLHEGIIQDVLDFLDYQDLQFL